MREYLKYALYINTIFGVPFFIFFILATYIGDGGSEANILSIVGKLFSLFAANYLVIYPFIVILFLILPIALVVLVLSYFIPENLYKSFNLKINKKFRTRNIIDLMLLIFTTPLSFLASMPMLRIQAITNIILSLMIFSSMILPIAWIYGIAQFFRKEKN